MKIQCSDLRWPDMEETDMGEKGIALFLVLWILVILSVIVAEFSVFTRTELLITRNFKEKTQSYYIAEAGIYKGIVHIIKSLDSPRRIAVDDGENEHEPLLRVNISNAPVKFAQGNFLVRMDNESGKININKAESKLLEVMLNPFELDDETKRIIIDSIMDWRDKDNLHRLNGAEDDYYRTLPEPYECKDGYFDNEEELLKVKGMTPEIFYGGLDKMITVIFDRKADDLKNLSRKEKKKKKKKKKAFDYNKVNINAAPLSVLQALPGMNQELALEICEYRKEKDFSSTSELGSILEKEVYAGISPYITIKSSPFYTIRSTGIAGEDQASHEIKSLLLIDKKMKKNKYRFLRWWDESFSPATRGEQIAFSK